MRGDDHLRQLEQRARRARLGGEDVDSRAADLAGAHRVGQRLLVDSPPRAALTISTPGLVLASWSAPIRPERLGGLGQVDRDRVGPRQQLVQVDQLDAQLGGPRRGHVGVVGDQLGAEAGQPLRDQLADLAEADHADGLAVTAPRRRTSCASIAQLRRLASAAGMRRATASSSAMACSAAETMFDVGALTTITPRSVAAGTSTLSSPTPALATTLSRGAWPSASASTRVARAHEQRLGLG